MTLRPRPHGREGSALVIVLVLILSLSVLGLTATQVALARSRGAAEAQSGAAALWAAEAGVGLKLFELQATNGAASDDVVYGLADGSQASVTVEAEGTFLQVRSSGVVHPGAPGEVRRTLEVYVRSSLHPLFYKVTYVGNAHGQADYRVTFGPDQPMTTTLATYVEGTYRSKNTSMSEYQHQTDLNGDGDLDDAVTLEELWVNRVAWGWDPAGAAVYIQASGNNRRLDLNRDGDFSDTHTATVTTTPQPRDPSQDNPAETPMSEAEWQAQHASPSPTGGSPPAGDYLEGDVYVNGQVILSGGTNAFGGVEATGEITGAPVAGTATEQAQPIAPPDLGAMNYEQQADLVVTSSNIPSFMRGQQAESYYESPAGPGGLGGAGDHTNRHFHLGSDSSNSITGQAASDFGALDGKLIVVQGNLWIHGTSSLYADLPAGEDTQVTIVVEGNLYIADDLDYNNGASGNTAVLFIVKGDDQDAESYTDTNRNYRRDPGEPLLNDDGDGVYEGPVEGQGNVIFGDPRFGTGGITDGYVYAENNVYLVNPPVGSNPDRVFGVHGFLSAGGIMDLGARGDDADYNNFRVKYDPRLQSGEVSFKGMPTAFGGGFEGLTVVSWREE